MHVSIHRQTVNQYPECNYQHYKVGLDIPKKVVCLSHYLRLLIYSFCNTSTPLVLCISHFSRLQLRMMGVQYPV